MYSEIDVGTTFRVYFPIAEAPDGPVRTHLTAARAPLGHGQTILLVEDEPALGESIARMLDGAGYNVLSATGGPAALALADRHRCELLLTDIVMPEMSGTRLAELLHQRHPELPVLYMSGHTNGFLGTTRILGPGIAFIEKPFTAHLLLTEVDKAITMANAAWNRVQMDSAERHEYP